MPSPQPAGVLPLALFVSKFEQRWHILFIEKFFGYYDLRTVYILEYVRRQGYEAFIDWLNAHIRDLGVKTIFLDTEFFLGLGLDLILRISREVRIVLVTFDDVALHEVNYINALGCDLVTCADPIAVMKYREKGVRAELFFLENSRKIFDEFSGMAKDIDVLFFGDLTKGGRREFIEGLVSRGVAITVHSPAPGAQLSYRELAHLISKAKIVLNFSRTHTMAGRPEAFVPVGSYLQFKGRVLEAGLANAACVSEYAPSIECMFGNDTIPMFETLDECAAILRNLLDHPMRREELAKRLHDLAMHRFEQTYQVHHLVEVVNSLPSGVRGTPKWIPYRYIATVVKSRFLEVRRPVKAWLIDLMAFLTRAKVYPPYWRCLAILEVLVKFPARVRQFVTS